MNALARAWRRVFHAESVASPAQAVNVLPIGTWEGGRPKPAEIDVRNLINDGYRRNVVIFACVNEIASTAAGLEVLVRNRKTKDPAPDDHPLVKLLREPSPGVSFFELMERTLIQLKAAGVAYVHKGRVRGGMPARLSSLRPDRMTPVPASDGTVLRYDYTVDGRAYPIPAEDVIRILQPDPLNDFHGLSPIAVIADWANLDTEAASFLRDYFFNGAIPAGVLIFKRPVVKEEERERVRDQWQESYGRGTGRMRNWWRVGVLTADVDYKEIGPNPDKLRLDGVWGMTETRICMAFGVPPIMVQTKIGLQQSTYSNYETAERSFWRETMVPTYWRLDDALTLGLGPEFTGDYEVVFNLDKIPALQESEDARTDRALKLFTGGLITRSSARRRVGEDEELGEDYIMVPALAKRIDKNGVVIVEPVPPQLLPGPNQPALPPAPDDKRKPKPAADDVDDAADDEPPPEPEPTPEEEAQARRVEAEYQRGSDGEAVAAVIEAEHDRLMQLVLAASRTAQSSIDLSALSAGISSGSRKAAEAAVDIDGWGERYSLALWRQFDLVAPRAHRAAYLAIAGSGEDAGEPEDSLREWAEKEFRAEVARTKRETRAAVRAGILHAIRSKIEPEEGAALVASIVGLNERQALSVLKLVEKQAKRAAEGHAKAKPKASPRKYATKLQRQRAQTIGRQQTARIAAKAQEAAWQRLIRQKVITRGWRKLWIAHPDACQVCEPLDGEEIPMSALFDDQFSGPPEPHPTCKCRLALVPPERERG